MVLLHENIVGIDSAIFTVSYTHLDVYKRQDVGDCIDYYFMYGGSADGVIAQIRLLTGSVPMMPLWSYGFMQSKERYKSQDEVVSVVKKYRELGIPLDCKMCIRDRALAEHYKKA